MRSPLLSLLLYPLNYPEILLVLSLLSFLFFLHHRLLHRITAINWPIVGAIPTVIANSHRIHDWITDILRNSGGTYIFKLPWNTTSDVLFTCDPSNVRHVFISNFSNYPKGPEFVQHFDVAGEGIINADFDSWAFQRRKAHEMLSDSKFLVFVTRSTKSKLETGLLPLLQNLAESGRVLDMQDLFLRLTFDLTSHFVFGFDPCCLSPDFPTIPLAKAMDDAAEIVAWRHMTPSRWLQLQKKFNFGSYKKMGMAREVIDRTIAEFIEKRREINRSKAGDECDEHGADLLSSYMNCQSEIGKDRGDFDKFLRDTMYSSMLAGRDTTGSALTWFFWLLDQNPHVEQKIIQELELHVPENPSFPHATELKKLVYLHAALCESLRLYPPIPFEHKAAVNPDILPSGVPVDKSRRIMFSVYAMGRMESIWGKDFMEYKPERWLSETGKIRHEPSYKFFVFNSGPRTCLGKDLAFKQMKTVVAAVITRFKLEVVEGFVARPKLSIMLCMEAGLKVRVKKRGIECYIKRFVVLWIKKKENIY